MVCFRYIIVNTLHKGDNRDDDDDDDDDDTTITTKSLSVTDVVPKSMNNSLEFHNIKRRFSSSLQRAAVLVTLQLFKPSVINRT
jgi:hypothetical protein